MAEQATRNDECERRSSDASKGCTAQLLRFSAPLAAYQMLLLASSLHMKNETASDSSRGRCSRLLLFRRTCFCFQAQIGLLVFPDGRENSWTVSFFLSQGEGGKRLKGTNQTFTGQRGTETVLLVFFFLYFSSTLVFPFSLFFLLPGLVLLLRRQIPKGGGGLSERQRETR